MKTNKKLHSLALASIALVFFLILVSFTASANKYTSPETSSDGPALCAHNGDLYIAWKSDSNNNFNVAKVNVNGDTIMGLSDKITLSDMSPTSPALTSFNGRLYIAWKSNSNANLNVMYSTDGGKIFINKYTSQETSSDAPALCVHNGNLYIAWKSNSNNNLNVAKVDVNGNKITGFSHKVTLDDTSSVGPALTSFNGRLYIAWKGNSNANLNVIYSTDGGKTFVNKYTSAETSSDSPALCVHNGNLYIAWKSDSNSNLNVAKVDINENKITGFSHKVILNDISSVVTPGLTSFNNRLYIVGVTQLGLEIKSIKPLTV